MTPTLEGQAAQSTDRNEGHPFFSVHCHSLYSSNDAISNIAEMAIKADELGWPALGLTDHGRVTGNLLLYKHCRKAGIAPLPGIELYVCADRELRIQGHNLHLTLNAYTETGYRNLCKIATRTAQQFYYKPLLDLADLAELADQGATQGLSVATGCWFGLLPTIMREVGPAAADQMANALASWFPRVYVELQAHGIDQYWDEAACWEDALRQARISKAYAKVIAEVTDRGKRQAELEELAVGYYNVNIVEHSMSEDEMVEALRDVAYRTGLPTLIASDNHYIEAKDQHLHDALKSLCSWSDDPDDATFPGGPYSMPSKRELYRFFEPAVVEEACANLAGLAEAASVRIPELDHFRVLIPEVSLRGEPDAELGEKARAGLAALRGGAEHVTKAESQRLEHELEVIAKTGFASALLLTIDLCEFMLREGIVFNARGSANNSFVNYATGITNADAGPTGWNLRFERFMSIDRTKPPDVDLDIERERRGEVVAYAASKYTVAQIGTLMKYKLHEDEEGEDRGRGSLRTRYFKIKRDMGRPIADWRDVPEQDKKMLYDLSDRKLVSGYGTHPAGIILAPDTASIAMLPMVAIGSDKTRHLVTAYDKNDVEDLGFIKGDLLGSRILTAVAISSRLIMEDEGISGLTPMQYLKTIPMTDAAVFKRLSQRRTQSTFQLQESFSTDFASRMKPKNIRELVHLMALARPAAMTSGTAADFLARRAKKMAQPNMHEDIKTETRLTYGTILYQEQVIGLCRAIGMEIAELNAILKALKASNDYVAGAKEVIARNVPKIRELATARGWTEADIALLIDAIEGYADYGFNEGHAVAYGYMAYWTAWLAANYPIQWWTGVLVGYTGDDHEVRYVTSARREGVRVVPAHVNISELSYTYDREIQAIRRGLTAVDKVGDVIAAELLAKAPYESVTDLAKRVSGKVTGVKQFMANTPLEECGGALGELYDAGALEGLV